MSTGGASSMTSFQVLSDLHLEVGAQYDSFTIIRQASFLILAGDVGSLLDYSSYLSFLATQTAQFTHILLVLGNHEFHGLSYLEGIQKARMLEKEPILEGKLILLHRNEYEVERPHRGNLVVLGCTLWSHIHDEAKDVVRNRVSDFKSIRDWTVDDHNAAHDADLAWLRKRVLEIQEENQCQRGEFSRRKEILVITHHAPTFSGTSAPQHAQNPWTCALQVSCWMMRTSRRGMGLGCGCLVIRILAPTLKSMGLEL